MPYTQHNVVRIQGTMPGGEVWSVNLRFAQAGADIEDYEDLADWAEAIGEAIASTALIEPLRIAMSVQCAINVIRTEFIGPGGALTAAAEYTLPTPRVGIGNATKPFQTAIVCSLLTRRPGRSYRGRIYWPALAVSMENSTLRLALSTRTTLLTGFAALFDLIRAAAGPEAEMNLIVASEVLGVNSLVQQISVGDVIDTQRRRRDSLQEQYSTAEYAPFS